MWTRDRGEQDKSFLPNIATELDHSGNDTCTIYTLQRNPNTLTTPLAQASQNKFRNLCYSIIAPTLLARVNERLRCQGLK
jgi:hypothetical protein